MLEPKELAQLPEDKEVPLSEVTKVIVNNYTITNELKEQLKTLQQWVSEQKKLTDKK
jgi:hypothetical protein